MNSAVELPRIHKYLRAVGKRSKWMSKGWWKYQARRLKVAATKASAFLWAKGKALWLRLFPTKLSDDELLREIVKCCGSAA